jgi:hypothetical protein
MSLNKAVENLKYDSRLLEMNLQLGRVTQAEYDQHIKSLADLESESLKVDLEEKTNELN